MKLAIGTDGSATAIPADAANGLDVDVTRVTGTVTIAGAVTNAGTFVTQENGAALTALQLIDDPVATLGTTTYTEATTKGMVVGAVRRDANTTLVDTTNEVAPLQVNAAGQLKVDGSAVTQPVSLTSTTITGTAAVTQSGTWTVQPGNTANTTAWKVDGSAVTQPVSGTVTANAGTGTMAVSIASVPSHAVTNAGTFATQVDGAALTALQLIDDTVVTLGTTTYTEATTKANVIGAVRRDANTTLVDTTNEIAPLQVNAGGQLKVDGSAVTQPVSGTVTANAGTGTLAVSIATAPVLVAGTAVIGKVGIDQTTPGTTNAVALTAGTATNEIVGDVAEDAALAGNPLRVGVRAHATVPTAMSADNDVVTPWADLSGGLVVIPQPRTKRITATPTIATSGYVANDQVGGLMTFTGAALATGRSGQVIGATLTTRAPTATNTLELWLFAASPTIASTDNAAFDLTDANLEAGIVIGVLSFSPGYYRASASNAVCIADQAGGLVQVPYVTSGAADIFGVLVARTVAAQYAGTTDIIVALTVNQF